MSAINKLNNAVTMLDVVNTTNNVIDNASTNDLSNLTNIGKSKISNYGSPSDTYISLTLGTTGTFYTAPADGWISFTTVSTNTKTVYIYLVNQNSQIYSYAISNPQVVAQGSVPCKKGDVITLWWSGNTTVIDSFLFTYAVGSEHEYVPS